MRIAGKLTGPVSAWVVTAAWLLIVVVMGAAFAGQLAKVQKDDAASWLPSSAESTRALHALDAVQDPNDITATVVYHRAGGLTPRDLRAIAAQAPRIAKLDGVTTDKQTGKPSVLAALTPRLRKTLVSPDGQVATTQVTFNFGSQSNDRLLTAVDHLRDLVRIPGVDTYVGGQGGDAADQAKAFQGIDGVLLLSAMAVVVVILLITYRSPVLWILPLLSVGGALVTAMGVVYLLAQYAGLTVNGMSRAILYVLVFGAGTDYALLLIARYREELRRHVDRHQAMAFALRRAAPAILASAATVSLGMLCLLVAELNSTAGLGPVCAVGVVVCLVVMLTLLPALLVLCGRWVFWPARPTYGSAEPTATGFWARVGARIAHRPRAVWVTTALVLLVCAGGLATLRAGGLYGADQYTKTFDSITGDRLVAAHGLADQSSPVEVVSDPGTRAAVLAAMKRAGFRDAVPVTTPPATVSVVAAPLSVDPSSQRAYDAVRTARAAVHAVPGAHAMVTGLSASNLDIRTATDRDAQVIIPLVLVVVMIILMLLLRAVLAPLLLMLTVVLSFAAALGLSSLVFDKVLGFAGADPSFPLYVFVFLVALGIDYNIFLMTRVREETAEHGTRQGSLVALRATGGVITSAGVVLAATFAVLSTLPFVTFVEVGLAVAIGVLLDTMVVRSVLVTALNLDVGPRIWWPSMLDHGERRADEQPLVSLKR